jgi:cyclopropane fatty-acyl-phospholipid synthase-like methyltransferase
MLTVIVLAFSGCGSGLSGETLTENGHQWIGLDVSQSMLSMSAWVVQFCNISSKVHVRLLCI